MKWKEPPIIKIYEALGAVADKRIKVSDNTTKVFSSTGNKFYEVSWDAEKQAIMTNDNGSYWKGYLGYPAIAFLLKIGVLEYKSEFGDLLKGIAWKDINQKFKNDFDKTLKYILSLLYPSKVNELQLYASKLIDQIIELDLSLLGKKIKPPEGY